ncbi:putative non-specific serine/threonine protein kinase [Helianthus annuus]|uniref:Non-specific serine/threonine protein kinase n=1 Tax=Helianthus annuus TaxID=4232 RepID=A0A251TBD4_HELAN|nr:putative non-specific serine/threonine protein kinase [Helianthus annuus]KAJ0501810.1 putative non-specific serine/threonine protein kinase [Helianthus annuus]KAJ0509732.1 putative non-specific serine/threonine protein kinase [Helianthus annuus]KAJ0517737.1 putative non-specific serine/threonine protein kinase [Helianthus annuus]KAJ0685753.1 putative non-specific serine/threonine protein kinase [Helianthus annuus]
MVDLLISNNMLSGSIPRSLSRLTNLTTLDLFGNLLTGLIPLEFSDSLKLQVLYLGKNQLSSTIPRILPSVRKAKPTKQANLFYDRVLCLLD